MKSTATALLALLLLTGGCAKLTEKLVIEPDGSGSFSFQLDMSPQLVTVLKAYANDPEAGMVATGIPFAIPMSEDALRHFGDGKEFQVKHARVEDLPDGGKRISATVVFREISKFIDYAYNTFFSCELTQADKSSMDFVAGPFGIHKLGGYSVGQLAELPSAESKLPVAAVKFRMPGFVYRLDVTFPGKIISSNAQVVDGAKASWLIDVDKLKDEDVRAVIPIAVFKAGDVKFQLPAAKPWEAIVPERFKRPPEIAGKEFAAVLKCVDLTRTISYALDKPPSTVQHLTAELQVWYPEGVRLIAYSHVVVLEAVTDVGEDASRNGNNSFHDFPMPIMDFEDKGFHEVEVDIGRPNLPFKSLRVLRGSLELTYSPATKSIPVEDPSKWSGKLVNIPELIDLAIVIDQISENSVVISCPVTTLPHIKTISFKDAKGNVLLTAETGWNLDGRPFNVSLPKDGSIVFEVNVDPKTVLVPFEFKDLSVEQLPQKLPF